jgi:hypothetical protein
MWEPRLLATLGASTARNRDIFTFTSDETVCSLVARYQVSNGLAICIPHIIRNIEAVASFVTLVTIYQTTQRHIPEGSNPLFMYLYRGTDNNHGKSQSG